MAKKEGGEPQDEVAAMVQPLADYLVEASYRNMPIAHRAGQLLRDASALIVTVAQSPEPELPPAPETPPGETPEQQKKSEPQRMAPLYEKQTSGAQAPSSSR